MEEVKLLGEWSSPFTYRVIWALKLKCVNFQYIEEDLNNKSALLLLYNPVHKKVPVLVHGGKPVMESISILEYIDEMWPNNPLLPNDPYRRSQARFWAKFIDDKCAVFWNFFCTVGEEQEKAVKDCLQVLRTLEDYELGEKRFFGGDDIGLVDISLGWMAYWLGVMEDVVGMKLVEAQTFPSLNAWMENFKQVPVIKENEFDHHKFFTHFKQLRESFLASCGN